MTNTDKTVSTEELQQWAEKRGDDAGRLARELLPYRLASRTQEPAPVVTDDRVKSATVEFLLHRGERPFRVTRRGAELWEDYAPDMRAALTTALTKQEGSATLSGGEG